MPFAWLMQARTLKHAGDRMMELFTPVWRTHDVACEDFGLAGVALTQYGFALENALKGLLIHHDPPIAASGRFKWPVSGPHELVELGQKAGMTWDSDTTLFVDCLKEQMVWHGRYPTTMGERDYKTLYWGTVEGEMPVWMTKRFAEIFAGVEQPLAAVAFA